MREEAARFLEGLYAAYDGGGWAEIRCLTAALGTVERSVPRRWFPLTKGGLNAAAQWAARQAADWNVYYGVLPRCRAAEGRADAVNRAAWLWCDIDNAPQWETAANLLAKAELPPPSLAVCSGNGCHVYWRLAETLGLPDADSKTKFRSLLRRLCLQIGGEPDAAHADRASTDAARILRLPGTLNWKDTANPKPVTIVYENAAEHGLTAGEWNGLLPTEKMPVPAGKPAGTPPRFGSVHPLLREVSPEGTRHGNCVRLLMALKGRHESAAGLEAAGRDFCLLNHFSAEEMEAILAWAARR